MLSSLRGCCHAGTLPAGSVWRCPIPPSTGAELTLGFTPHTSKSPATAGPLRCPRPHSSPQEGGRKARRSRAAAEKSSRRKPELPVSDLTNGIRELRYQKMPPRACQRLPRQVCARNDLSSRGKPAPCPRSTDTLTFWLTPLQHGIPHPPGTQPPAPPVPAAHSQPRTPPRCWMGWGICWRLVPTAQVGTGTSGQVESAGDGQCQRCPSRLRWDKQCHREVTADDANTPGKPGKEKDRVQEDALGSGCRAAPQTPGQHRPWGLLLSPALPAIPVASQFSTGEMTPARGRPSLAEPSDVPG